MKYKSEVETTPEETAMLLAAVKDAMNALAARRVATVTVPPTDNPTSDHDDSMDAELGKLVDRVLPFRPVPDAQTGEDGEKVRIVAGQPYVALTAREEAARNEWLPQSPDSGQHDTWKYLVQYALWRFEEHDDARPLPSRWAGRAVDAAPLFPLHPQLCEAMRRLHPWRLLAAAMGFEGVHAALSTDARGRIDTFLSAHIAAAKRESEAIYARTSGSDNAVYASVGAVESIFAVFPNDVADWTAWPALTPIPQGEPTYE